MKLNLVAMGCVDASVAVSNDRHARSLGLPFIGGPEAHGRKLAVVGGGNSITYHRDEITGWNGDIWAINGAFDWCRVRGIDATFVSIDPQPAVANYVVHCKQALLATVCDPVVFDTLQGADVRLLGIYPFGDIGTGVTTATAIPGIAARLGYGDVTFFGCESSFTHSVRAYNDDRTPYIVRVECGGVEFTTEAEYLMQAQALATIMRAMPDNFKERSGGLLRALIENPEVEIVAVSPTIMNSLRETV